MNIMTKPLVPPGVSGPIHSLAGMTAYTVLRVAVGVIMVAHGLQKLMGVSAFEDQVADMGFPLPELFSRIAIAAEFMGGAGVLIGLLTPLAAFGVLMVLLTAIFGVHLENGLFAKDGGFEFPLTLACAALLFMLNGAGAFSVDAMLARGGKRPSPERFSSSREAVVAREHELPRPSGHLPSDGPVDSVTQAGMESFPASDPPAHSHRA